MQVRVERRTVEAPDVCALELAAVTGAPLPAFAAGAHVDVRMKTGILRPYSLLNDPVERSTYVLGVKLDAQSRGGSKEMHSLTVGDCLDISEPRNRFSLSTTTRHVLIAGGIGVTPLLSMAATLQRRRADFVLHYITRSLEETPFRSLVASSGFADRVRHHHSHGNSRSLDLAGMLYPGPEDSTLYVCGPQGLMDTVRARAREAGWADEQFVTESFARTAPGSGSQAFEVVCARSGRILEIPGDRTVAEVLIASGIDVPVSCQQGVCGTCLTDVLGGLPDHRDVYLTAEERNSNSMFLPCCSRALTPRLVIDR